MIDIPISKALGTKRRLGNPTSPLHPCICCGNAVRNPRYYIHVVNGGGKAASEEESPAHVGRPDDLGLHVVGPDCRKLFPKGYVVDLPDLARYWEEKLDEDKKHHG